MTRLAYDPGKSCIAPFQGLCRPPAWTSGCLEYARRSHTSARVRRVPKTFEGLGPFSVAQLIRRADGEPRSPRHQNSASLSARSAVDEPRLARRAYARHLLA